MPRPCRRALDVGCGHGEFARSLSLLSARLEALDRDPAAIARARALSRGEPNLTFIEGDFLSLTPEGRLDFISMIASLHHMPLGPALAHAAKLLRPGGVLAILGLFRLASPADLAASALALPASWLRRAGRPSPAVPVQLRDPEMSLPEIRRALADALPGARARRHLYWRYSVIWMKPSLRH